LEELNFSDPVADSFLNRVGEFCRDIERPDWNNAHAFIEAIHKILVRLYSYGLELSLVDLTKWYADILELEENVRNIALQKIQRNTPSQYYWTALNQLEFDVPSTGTGDLIDVLFDMYKELILGITYFDKVDGYQEWAFWTLKIIFSHHWSDY
jgi:hypothetical protein